MSLIFFLKQEFFHHSKKKILALGKKKNFYKIKKKILGINNHYCERKKQLNNEIMHVFEQRNTFLLQ